MTADRRDGSPQGRREVLPGARPWAGFRPARVFWVFVPRARKELKVSNAGRGWVLLDQAGLGLEFAGRDLGPGVLEGTTRCLHSSEPRAST